MDGRTSKVEKKIPSAAGPVRRARTTGAPAAAAAAAAVPWPVNTRFFDKSNGQSPLATRYAGAAKPSTLEAITETRARAGSPKCVLISYTIFAQQLLS